MPVAFIFSFFKIIKNNKAYLVVSKPNETTGKLEKYQYTPYFIQNHINEEYQHQLKLFITLGSERLPPEYETTSDPDLCPQVFEVYCINNKDENVTFTPLSIQFDNNVEQTLSDTNITVHANTENISPPLISYDIGYSTEIKFLFKYKIDDKQFELKDSIQRLTTEEIREYNPANPQEKFVSTAMITA